MSDQTCEHGAPRTVCAICVPKAVAEYERNQHRPKHHKAADFDQVIIAKELFEWWWRVGTPNPDGPRWDECLEHIQAFWMDGAWQVLSLKVTTLTGKLHR